mmetsp:Transcript_5713/g.4914  ORF Transcript_5713/g.4914 Transcript_5713/m.4914 type:complete len:105 (+) Transcript_5713:60-374(+)
MSKTKFHGDLLNKMQGKRNTEKVIFDIKNFKLKRKPKRQGVKLEQLHKEAEIFIMKSQKRKFSIEDLNRFLNNLDLRKEVQLNESIFNENSFMTKNTFEEELKE